MIRDFSAAVRDLVDGVRLAPFWWQLGIDQTVSRFRRTILGPFWLSANMIAISIALTVVFSGLLGSDYHKTFPLITGGILVWSIIGQAIADASPLFLTSAGQMQVQKLPISFYIFVFVQKTAINFLAQFIAFEVMMLLLGVWVLPSLLLIPALALIFMNLFFISLLAAMPSTRFRDLGFMVQFGVQILFFLTPVFWSADNLSPTRRLIVEWSPFAHELELLRRPLLGLPQRPEDWVWTLSFGLVLAACSLIALTCFRKRIVFWL